MRIPSPSMIDHAADGRDSELLRAHVAQVQAEVSFRVDRLGGLFVVQLIQPHEEVSGLGLLQVELLDDPQQLRQLAREPLGLPLLRAAEPAGRAEELRVARLRERGVEAVARVRGVGERTVERREGTPPAEGAGERPGGRVDV
eukprot:CAMPEP_0182835378 /NCGR_PEP_ID=MMETSP0006_2-20121128/21465_1 /TAXON_ID=97485 /ORGANISM="Prymnesium parvum, Strain Texoma1" /LENGTH=142 /DNA_ID=CAMNT_0024963785 /DNA_START=190 /DNA_END=619 /DNA_ORIENTATION=-